MLKAQGLLFSHSVAVRGSRHGQDNLFAVRGTFASVGIAVSTSAKNKCSMLVACVQSEVMI